MEPLGNMEPKPILRPTSIDETELKTAGKGKPKGPGGETVTVHATGNFKHFKRKKRFFYYEEIRKRKDKLFHNDIGTGCDTYFRGRAVKFKMKQADIFYHIVDADHYDYHKIVFESYLILVLQSAGFRVMILGLVILSSLLTGVATFPTVQDEWSEVFKTIDQIILSVFIFEIMLKWMYDFRLFWTGFWNYMDFIVVAMIIFTSVFPFTGGGPSLNVIRVIRAFRSLKSLSSLSSLTIVYHTVIKSGIDLLNILIVLLVFMLVLSIMGVILFDTKELNDLDEAKFLNALDAWYVLFVCLTEDGWNDWIAFYRTSDYFPHIAAYLILAVSVGAFVFANLIVAVIVANLELSVKEMQVERMLHDDPLDTKEGFIIDELTIVPTYNILATRGHALLCQRPMKIPTMKHISLRRLQTYIHLIVALEHNMIEAEVILNDFQKVMAVILSIILQLDTYSDPKIEEERERGREVLEELRKLSIYPNEKPKDAFERLQRATELSRLKQAQHAQAINPSKHRTSSV